MASNGKSYILISLHANERSKLSKTQNNQLLRHSTIIIYTATHSHHPSVDTESQHHNSKSKDSPPHNTVVLPQRINPTSKFKKRQGDEAHTHFTRQPQPIRSPISSFLKWRDQFPLKYGTLMANTELLAQNPCRVHVGLVY